MPRGTFGFDVTPTGELLDSPMNAEALRRLWLDRLLVRGDDIGPGNPGDFDDGAWHSSCHLVAGGGVRRAANGSLLWLEISHDPADDHYFASVTARNGRAETVKLDSSAGRALLEGSKLLGFVEGNSKGRISARGVTDPRDRFNHWRRQDFDKTGANDRADGGKVWEHWCTTRDIRPGNRYGSAVLTAYVALTAALTDLFAAVVARGRRVYGHPVQLAAMVEAGFVAQRSALADITPRAMSREVEALFNEAEPAAALEAASKLEWGTEPRYYMFGRRIASWSKATDVRNDLRSFVAR
jgi:hypothetical protein